MTRKLEETFNLPPMKQIEEEIEELEDEQEFYSEEEMHHTLERANKVDAALPQVTGLEQMDKDYDDYAKLAIDAFEDLVDLGKNVEDRHTSDIFQAASSMMSNAITAKTNKAQKKIEMIKLQIAQDKLKHEQEKLEYQKQRYLVKDKTDAGESIESEGTVLTSRNDLIRTLISDLKDEDNGSED